jgi:hypothetical protein
LGEESLDRFVFEKEAELPKGTRLIVAARREFDYWLSMCKYWEGRYELKGEDKEYYEKLTELLNAVKDRAWEQLREVERDETEVFKEFNFVRFTFNDWCRSEGLL